MDVDECISGVAICPRQSECKNTIGSYDCPCIAGHELQTDEIDDQEGNLDFSAKKIEFSIEPQYRLGFTVVTLMSVKQN